MFTAYRQVKSQAYTPVGTMSVKAEVCNLVRRWAEKVDHTQAQAHRSMAQEVARLPMTHTIMREWSSK